MSDTNSWYVAVVVLQSVVHGPSGEPPLIDHQVRLLFAPDAETAYQRAQFLGRSEESSYQNASDQQVSWKFLGLHDLAEIENPPSDGAEVYSFRLNADRAFEVLPKEKLTCFWLASLPDKPISELFD